MTEPINSEVIDQITQRSNILKKGSNRTVDDLHFLLNRTGWVRVISSVNTQEVIDKLTGNPYQTGPLVYPDKPDLAKTLILTGPVDYSNDQIKLKSGINFTGYSSQNLYNLDSETGFRPAPGLTDFKVTSKNTYGTLRECTINFVVWTLKELNDIEMLYFRPGYSVVVEWGHTLYVDNTGKIEYSPSFNTNLPKYFEEVDFDELSQIQKSSKSNHSYNYDALVGLIKNFSWSFRPDGGYDCSISITSLGEVLESLTVRLPPPVIPRLNDESDSKKLRTFIDLFIHELENEVSLTKYRGVGQFTLEDFPDTSYVKNILLSKIDKTRVIACGFRVEDTGETVYYIPIRVFLQLVNLSFSIIYDPENCTVRKNLSSFDTRPYAGGNYNTFPDHFSLDPLICLMPKIPANDPIRFTLTKDNVHNNIINGESSIQPEAIYSINITTSLIKKTLDSYLTPTGNAYEFSVYSFVKSIAEEVNRALGITELDLAYDEDTALYTIVDRRNTLNIKSPVETPTLRIAGLDSSIIDLQVQSKISNKLGSVISIAAQGSKTNYLENTGLWTDYNKGLVDRHSRKREALNRDCFPDPTSLSTTAQDQRPLWLKFLNLLGIYYIRTTVKDEEKDEATKFLETANQAYRLFTTTSNANGNFGLRLSVGKYAEDLFTFLKNVGPRFFNEMVSTHLANNNEPEKGLIPVELGFTLDGIGGLKIGQNFKISGEFIPDKFNNYGYIITGLEHSIKNSKWLTDVKAQTYLLNKSTDEQYFDANSTGTVDISTSVGGTGLYPKGGWFEWLVAIGTKESGLYYRIQNKADDYYDPVRITVGTNANGRPITRSKEGFTGKYQFGYSALQSHAGSEPKSTYRDKPELQEQSMWSLVTANKKQLQDIINKYGKGNYKINGTTITESGILAGAHLGGAGGVRSYFATNKDARDSNNTSVSSYMIQFSGYDMTGYTGPGPVYGYLTANDYQKRILTNRATKTPKQDTTPPQNECILLGDSIAVGIGSQAPDCKVFAKVGINSAVFNKTYTQQFSADVVAISLGSNDPDGLDTEKELRNLRSRIKAKRVYWVLPAIKPNKRPAIDRIARQNADTIINIPDLSSDGIHPTINGYKKLASSIKGSSK